jgi:hypothetical protein
LKISSNSNAKHLVRSSKDIDTAEEKKTRNAALETIDDVVKNSVLIETIPNQKPQKTDLKQVHRLYVPMRIEEKTVLLRVVAHEMKDESGLIPIETKLFDLMLEDKENSASPSGSTLSSAPPVTGRSGVSKITIREMLRGVKDAEGKPYLILDS